MKYFNLLIICFVLFFSCKNSAQKNGIKENDVVCLKDQCEETATIFLDINFTGDINIFDKPGGKIITTLKNNITEENFVMFDLLQKNDSMFYVIAYYSLDESIITKGWVFKNSHYGIYSRMYNPEVRPLILFENPNDTLHVIVKETKYNPNIYEVIDFDGNWLKVKVNINDKVYQGWIPPEMQCSNVYTTCS